METIKQTKESLKFQLEEKHKSELDPDGKENLISIKTSKQITETELEITKIKNDSKITKWKDLNLVADNCIREANEFESKSDYEKNAFLNGWTLLSDYESKALKFKKHLEDFYQNKKWEEK